MLVKGLEFFIPNGFFKEKEDCSSSSKYVPVQNYSRSDEHAEGYIGIFDLNKSDYIFEFITLLIVKKIKRSQKEKGKEKMQKLERLYSLIHTASLIAESITYYETHNFFNVESNYLDDQIINLDDLENVNKTFIDDCFSLEVI